MDSGECLSVLFGVEILSRGIARSLLSHAHTFWVHEHVCGPGLPQGAVRGCVRTQGQNERPFILQRYLEVTFPLVVCSEKCASCFAICHITLRTANQLPLTKALQCDVNF